MKKFFAFFLAIALCAICTFGALGCNKNNRKYTVYVPDGAPALSVTGMYALNKGDLFEVNVVAASTINAYVGGKNPQADFAVMPINAAFKLLGRGEDYKMLGTVTHGNLFLLKKGGEADINSVSNLSVLLGKTVGIINLENVPGLTFKCILSDNNVAFNVLTDGAEKSSEAVNLKNVTAQEAIPLNADCNYFVVPEPAASTKVNATGGALSFAGNLQSLYGEGGYPQAVAVAKTSVIENNNQAVQEFINALTYSSVWLKADGTSAEQIVSVVNGWISGDAAPTFTAQNLNSTVIDNCGIRFEANSGGKARALAYMSKINAITSNAWDTADDAFFY